MLALPYLYQRELTQHHRNIRHINWWRGACAFALPYPLPGGEGASSPPPWGEGLGESEARGRVGKRQYGEADILWHTRQGMTAHYSVVQIHELVEALNRITDERSRVNRSLAMIRREQLGNESPKKRKRSQPLS